jgi:hypothetical protein
LPKNTAFCVFTGTLLALDLIQFGPTSFGSRAVHPFTGAGQSTESLKKSADDVTEASHRALFGRSSL